MVATPTRQKSQKSQPSAKPTLSETRPEVRWEKLPDDFILPDDPVDNINQPAIAAALTQSLNLAGYLSEASATTTNYGICATVDDKTVVKAPDWSWIPAVSVPKSEIDRSYTPVLEGDLPLIVMEFLSETEGKEYSIKPTYPPGKWFYYERILQVPNYLIFEPKSGIIELYKLSTEGAYEIQVPNEDGLYWLEEANLFVGAWEGEHEGRTGWWLRWWDAEHQMLLWGEELTERERQRTEQERQRAEQERQKAEQERQRAEQERQRAEQAEQTQKKAIEKLMEMGLTIEQVSDTLSLSVEAIQQALQMP